MQAMQISAIALQGLDQAQCQVEQAGRQLADVGADTGPGSADTVSLSDAAVSLLSGKNQFATDVNLAHVADDLQKQAINLLA